MGPGKAALLDAIAQTGSISAAARDMGMSYRRAWVLVDVMNRCFDEQVVETVPGGGKSAGARVTPAGERALASYRQLEQQIGKSVTGEAQLVLETMIRAEPRNG